MTLKSIRDNDGNYCAIKTQYKSVKEFLKNNGNTQSCAKLWMYGYELLKDKGIVDGVLKFGSNSYFLLMPHEMNRDKVAELNTLLQEIFDTNWLGSNSGRAGTTSLVPTTIWWYTSNVDNLKK